MPGFRTLGLWVQEKIITGFDHIWVFKKEVTYLCNRISVKHLLICLKVYAAVAQWLCYLIAKTKVSGSNSTNFLFWSEKAIF